MTIPDDATAQSSRFDRRVVLRGGVAFGAGLAAVGTLARFGFAQEDAATPVAGGNATSAIVTAADAFLDTLSDEEREAVLFDWTDTAQRQRWSNLPEGGFERAGLMWANINEATQNAWLGLMQVTLSEEGYNRVIAEWNADEALANGQGGSNGGGGGGTPGAGGPGDGGGPPDGGFGNGTPGAGGPGDGGPQGGGTPGAGGGGGMGQLLYGKEYYWIAIIGTPSETDPWQWQWGGHHVTVNATVAGEKLSLTPSFIGVQPATYTDESGNTVRPLGDIEDEAFALINSLDDTQKGTAILGDTYMDLVLGPGQDGKTLQAEGLPASQMTVEQKAAFLHLIGHYIGLANDTAASARLDEVSSTIDDTYLAWYGSTVQGEAAYFRVTGPTIVIEYSPQSMGGDATDHIHGIYRDPTNDYGAKWTGVTITS